MVLSSTSKSKNMRVKTSEFLLLCFICNQTVFISACNEVLGVGFSADFLHESTVSMDQQRLFEGAAFLKISRLDSETFGFESFSLPKSDQRNSLVNSDDSLMLHINQRINSSIWTMDSNVSGWNHNYLKLIGSIFTAAYEHRYAYEYRTVEDFFGTCDLTISSVNESMMTVTRDLSRCSQFTNEVSKSVHYLPLLHLGINLETSTSTCTYEWANSDDKAVSSISCKDYIHIRHRFQRDSKIFLLVKSTIKLQKLTSLEFSQNKRLMKNYEDLRMKHSLLYENSIESDYLDKLLAEKCEEEIPEDHVTKEEVNLTVEIFHAFSMTKDSPKPLKYPCPPIIRRSLAYAAALVGGARFLNFFYDQLMLLDEERFEIAPNFQNPLVVVAVSNLAELNLNPGMSVPLHSFLQQTNVLKLKLILKKLLAFGSEAQLGALALLHKLNGLSPTHFEDIIEEAGGYLSPVEACNKGDVQEATRRLHAISALQARPLNFVSSLRSCFATEDVGVQVAAMSSLRTLDCKTPGTSELQQLALESPADPEIRIAAFKGLLRCFSGHETTLRSFKSVLNSKSESYSKHVASFAWSYIHAILESVDFTQDEIRLELLKFPELTEITDPVADDFRHYSRYLEYDLIIDHRTSLKIKLELIWGRVSLAPRSIMVGLTLYHDAVRYDVFEVTLRFSGMEECMKLFTKLLNFDEILDNLKSNWKIIEDFWKAKREVDQNFLEDFVSQLITRIPQSFQKSGSSVELSISLFGVPVHHFHYKKVELLIIQLPEIISKLLSSGFHSEILQLWPYVDNIIEIGTTLGSPISLQMSGLNTAQLLMSHNKEMHKANFILRLSNLIETQMKIGVARVENKSVETRFTRRMNSPSGFSDVSLKYQWILDLPMKFEYELKPDQKIFKLFRPQRAPHYIIQMRKQLYFNGKSIPLRISEKCVMMDEPVTFCWEESESKNFEDELQILNQRIFHPKVWALKVNFPTGNEPVILVMKYLNSTSEEFRNSVTLKIPTILKSNIIYEGIFDVRLSNLSSFSAGIKTPIHKYQLESYYSFDGHTNFTTELRVSNDGKISKVKFQMTYPLIANQRIVSTYISVKFPHGINEEEVLKTIVTIKELPNYFSLEVTGKSHGPLANIINVTISGGIKKEKEDSLLFIYLNEADFLICDRNYFNISGHFKKDSSGFDGSLLVMLDGHYNIEHSFSYMRGDLGGSAHLLPEEVRMLSLAGGNFNILLLLTNSNLEKISFFNVSGSIKQGEMEIDANIEHSDETGRILFFIVYQTFWNFRSILSAEVSSRNISWSTTQELVVDRNNYRIGFNASWSLEERDHFGVLLHFTSQQDLDHSFIGYIVVPDQRLEIFHDFSKSVAQSYKHNIIVKADPGREIMMNTIAVSGADPNTITYGLSVDFKLDSWEDVLRFVGTASCLKSLSTCSVNMDISQGPNQIAEFEAKYTGSYGGVSRTDIRITSKDYLNFESSVDTILMRGLIKSRVFAELFYINRILEGEIKVNVKSNTIFHAEFVLYNSKKENVRTHYYNASVNVNRDQRTITGRQELWNDIEGSTGNMAIVLHAKIGKNFINEKHFIKVATTTPFGNFYAASGEISTTYLPSSFAIGNIALLVKLRENQTYLLSFEQNSYTSDKFKKLTLYNNEKMEQVSQESYDLYSMTTSLRLKTPESGETKIHFKADQSVLMDGEDLQFNNYIEARLVTDKSPDLGRFSAKLTHNSKAYSLSSTISSDTKSLSIESYRIVGSESHKLSLYFTAMNPNSSWGTFMAAVEGDHLGRFPSNFQSSVDAVIEVSHQTLLSSRVLCQRTLTTATAHLEVDSTLEQFSSRQFLLKWNKRSFQSKISWLVIRSQLEVEWDELGRRFEVAYKYSLPNLALSEIDTAIKFRIGKDDCCLLPQILILKFRFSVNNMRHWILNVDSNFKMKQLAFRGAVVRPHNPTSMSLEFYGFQENLYQMRASMIFQANSYHGAVTLKSFNSDREATVLIRSTLLPEPNGYIFKIESRAKSPFEIRIIWCEGSDGIPRWSHVYRVVVERTYINGGILKEMKINDSYIFEESGKLIDTKNFLAFSIRQRVVEKIYLVEISFPDWLPRFPTKGTINVWKEDKSNIISFRIHTLQNDHTIEGNITCGSSFSSFHLVKIIYQQMKIKGVGYPVQLLIEANVTDPQTKEIKIDLQKTIMPKYRKGQSQRDAQIQNVKTFQANVRLNNFRNLIQYHISWGTNDSTNEATILFDEIGFEKSFKVKYERFLTQDPSNDFLFIIDGRLKRQQSQVFCSLTLEHILAERPRSLTLVHTDTEAYTEIIFDMFESEEHQIIIVISKMPEEKSFKIGQIGNTFFRVAYETDKTGSNNETKLDNTVLIEFGGQKAEWRLSTVNDSDKQCRAVTFVTATAETDPLYNSAEVCSIPNVVINIQFNSPDEVRGSFVRLKSGTNNLIVGYIGETGMYRTDLDTPINAVTLNVTTFLGISLHLRPLIMKRVMEDFRAARDFSFSKVLRRATSHQWKLGGSLALGQALHGTGELFTQAIDVIQSFELQGINFVDRETIEAMNNGMVKFSLWLGNKREELIDEWELVLSKTMDQTQESILFCHNWLKKKEIHFYQIVENNTAEWSGMKREDLRRFAFTIAAMVRSVEVNDHRIFRLLMSRFLSKFHIYKRQQDVVSEILLTHLLWKFEQIALRALRWEALHERLLGVLRHISATTNLNFTEHRDASIEVQIPGFDVLPSDLRVLMTQSWLALTPVTLVGRMKVKVPWSKWRAKLLHGISWRVKASGSLIGWQSLVTFDGLYISPLLSDDCPHLLLTLTNQPNAVSIALHIEHSSVFRRKVLSFMGQSNLITVDSDLEVNINGEKLRNKTLSLNGIEVSKTLHYVRLSSSTGVALECYRKGDICLISVGAENFASTAGLLGVYDLEKSTDFMTSTWERPASHRDWSRSWRIPTAKTCPNASSHTIAKLVSNQEGECASLFSGTSSPFKDCFGFVPEDLYAMACEKSGRCSAVEAIRQHCRQHFIYIDQDFDACSLPDVRLVMISDKNIVENMDVYLICEIKSDPPYSAVEFSKDDNVIRNEPENGIIISGRNLTLYHISPEMAGVHSCTAQNVMGESKSNFLYLNFEHKPVCENSNMLVNVSRGEMVVLECRVKANPFQVNFFWSFGDRNENILLSESTYSSSGLISKLKFVPRSRNDFDEINCWASNKMGIQITPCEFHFNFKNYSDTCVGHSEEMVITEDLPVEILLIGDVSCSPPLKRMVNILRKETKGLLNLKLIHTNNYINKNDLDNEFDKVSSSYSENLLEIVSMSLKNYFSEKSLKIIVLFSCASKSCKVFNEVDKRRMETLSEEMRQRGITVYSITNERIQIKHPSVVPNKIKKQLLGINRRSFFLMSHARKLNLEGETDKRQYFTYPTNSFCAQLSIQSDGGMFSLQVLKKLRKKSHKRAFQKFVSQKIIEGQRNPRLKCTKCDCQKRCKLCEPITPFLPHA